MTLQIITTVELALAAIPATLFPVIYHVSTGGAWHRSAMGRHVMSLMVVLALLLDFSVGIRLFGRPDWITVVAVVLYGCVALLMWQRLWLLLKAQRRKDT